MTRANKIKMPETTDPMDAIEIAEPAEERDPTDGNARETTEARTQRRPASTDGLERIRAAARREKDAKFTALLHHVTPERLMASFVALKPKAAPGVDGMTWEEYAPDREARLADLYDRLHNGSYRTKPSKRGWIEKEDGKRRPLGIAALEDKIAQKAISTILGHIYEEDFLGFSYGFRPGRSQHQALDALCGGIMTRKVNWVLDADIRGYFDTIVHECMLKFLEHRIGDRRVLRLIRKWLKAGVLDEEEWLATSQGTPQGAVISPLLANVYLHYVFDLWARQWRDRHATGDVIIVRYADDFVVGFQHREEAERFLQELGERFAQFGLQLHPDKTRLIEFGRYAEERRNRRGERKPETFNFLGFTHICGRARQGGFSLKRKPMAKRMRRKLERIYREMRGRMHDKVGEQGEWLRQVLQGWYQYYALPDTRPVLDSFRNEITRLWLMTLRRRSQRARRKMTWEKMRLLADRYLPKARILHPYPDLSRYVTTGGRSRMR
jgi:group II intron reverse transcriptase/maturase